MTPGPDAIGNPSSRKRARPCFHSVLRLSSGTSWISLLHKMTRIQELEQPRPASCERGYGARCLNPAHSGAGNGGSMKMAHRIKKKVDERAGVSTTTVSSTTVGARTCKLAAESEHVEDALAVSRHQDDRNRWR